MYNSVYNKKVYNSGTCIVRMFETQIIKMSLLYFAIKKRNYLHIKFIVLKSKMIY